VLGSFGQDSDGGIILTGEPDVFNLRTDRSVYRNVRLGLKGAHQWENAKLAVLLAEILREHFSISDEAVVKGLAAARNPGRLEFTDGILFDGAHNAAGAEALAAYLRSSGNTPFTLVFGAMRDKDIGGMAAHLFGLAEKLIFTVAANSRSCDPREFLKYVPEAKLGECRITESAADAIRLAREFAEGDLIVVTGSLYLVGEVKRILEN
jgi:dihydrofolate synthase/folylpolyglutamate synthase